MTDRAALFHAARLPLLQRGVVSGVEQRIEHPLDDESISFRIRAYLLPLRIVTERIPSLLALGCVLKGDDVDEPVGVVAYLRCSVAYVFDAVTLEYLHGVVAEPRVKRGQHTR